VNPDDPNPERQQTSVGSVLLGALLGFIAGYGASILLVVLSLAVGGESFLAWALFAVVAASAIWVLTLTVTSRTRSGMLIGVGIGLIVSSGLCGVQLMTFDGFG